MEKEKARGKNSAMKRFLRKKTKNIIDERRLRMEALRKKEKEDRDEKLVGRRRRNFHLCRHSSKRRVIKLRYLWGNALTSKLERSRCRIDVGFALHTYTVAKWTSCGFCKPFRRKIFSFVENDIWME